MYARDGRRLNAPLHVTAPDSAAILDLLAARRSCRAFDGRPMPRSDVEAILADGLQAPSSCNQQQWHFVVVETPEQRREAQRIAGGNPHFLDCAVIVYLCFQKGWTHDKFSVVQSVAGACYHMMLSAQLRGYGSIWNAGIGDTRAIARMLRIPAIFEIQGALCLGHARTDVAPVKAPRRPLAAVSSWGRFDRPATSIYPVKAAASYPYFAISNHRNPFAVWNPAVWGWDRIADFRGYAVWGKSPLAGVYAPRRDMGIAAIELGMLPNLAPGARVLDVMPWGGTSTAMLRRRYGPSVHIDVAELSPHNHAFIRERLRQEGLSDERIHARRCTGGWIDCGDASVDVALLPRVLEHMPSRHTLLDELRRVLKPGGVALISVRNARSSEGLRHFARTARGQIPNTGPYRPVSAPALRRELGARFTFIDEIGYSVDDAGTTRKWSHRWRRDAPIYIARIVG